MICRWRICFWVSVVPAALLAVLMELCVESPHWLVKVRTSHQLLCFLVLGLEFWLKSSVLNHLYDIVCWFLIGGLKWNNLFDGTFTKCDHRIRHLILSKKKKGITHLIQAKSDMNLMLSNSTTSDLFVLFSGRSLVFLWTWLREEELQQLKKHLRSLSDCHMWNLQLQNLQSQTKGMGWTT